MIVKRGNKVFIRIPKGEVQIGLRSRRIVIWFNRKSYIINKNYFDKKLKRERKQ